LGVVKFNLSALEVGKAVSGFQPFMHGKKGKIGDLELSIQLLSHQIQVDVMKAEGIKASDQGLNSKRARSANPAFYYALSVVLILYVHLTGCYFILRFFF